MKSMVDVSVIIPVYNSESCIIHLLAALNDQTANPVTVEYIVVDNNSSDRTAEVVKRYAQTSKINIQCIDENDAQSSYAARNKGIKTAIGNILAFTDADCVPAPDWIETLVAGFTDSKIGAIAGAILPLRGNSLLEQIAAKSGILSQDNAIYHPHKPFGQTANIAFRRDVFRKCGMFRSVLDTGGDADMSWRMQDLSDYALHYARNAIVRHRHRSTFIGLAEQFERYGRSWFYLEQLHGCQPPRHPQTPYYTPYYILKLFVWALFRFPVLYLRYVTGRIERVDLYAEPIILYTRWLIRIGYRRASKRPLYTI
jgi:glycosyltransferase involved in cell wall biosynthesis